MLGGTSPACLTTSPPSAAARLRRAFGLGSVLIGATVLLGWALGLPTVKTVLPGLTTMRANTALGLVAAGAGVLLVPHRRGTAAARWRPLLASTAGVVSLLLGALTLLEYTSASPLGLDELLFADLNTTSPPYPGRMSPATAAGLPAQAPLSCSSCRRQVPRTLPIVANSVAPRLPTCSRPCRRGWAT